MGGSSSINAMVFIRGHAEDFNDWQAMGNVGWGWNNVLPYFKKSVTVSCSDSALRGKDSPAHFSDVSQDMHPANNNFIAACTKVGLSTNSDFNAESQEGIGYWQITTKNRRRMSSSRAYLRPAKRRKNLTIKTGLLGKQNIVRWHPCCGRGILLQRGVYQRNRREGSRAVSRFDQLPNNSCKCSDVGSKGNLQALDIPVLHHSPNVGRNLQDRLGMNYYYRSRVPTLNDQFNSLSGRDVSALQYLLFGSGPFSLSVNQSGGFVRSSANGKRPNIQLYYQPISYLLAPPGKRPMVTLDAFSGFEIGASQCRPKSRGYASVVSKDPKVLREIYPNCPSNEYDVEKMLESVKLIRKIASALSMQSIIGNEILPGAHVEDDSALIEEIRKLGNTVFHPVGTCSIGAISSDSVVDHRLKVHGLQNLRVVDASVSFLDCPFLEIRTPQARMVEEDNET